MVRSSNASADAHRLTLRITRQFDAPRELVWRAWTQPEHLARWFCPTDFTVLSAECDLRVGGRWRSAMRSPAGKTFVHLGEYREIEPVERLVFTHAWEENDEEELCQTDYESVITVTLTERDGGTAMLFEQVGFTSAESRDSHDGGWTESFNNLAAFVHAGSSGAAGSLAPTSTSEIVITRVFDAPRELVWEAWTAPEHIVRWWGPEGFRTEVEAHDFAVGSRWRYVMIGPDGGRYPGSGVFLEIVPLARIVQTAEFDEGVEDVIDGPLPEGVRLTATFEPVGQKTRLTLRISHPSEEDRRRHEAMGVIAGWASTLDCFAAHLREVAGESAGGGSVARGVDAGRGLTVAVGSAGELRLVHTFAAPRGRVFEAHTTPALLKRWCFGPDGFEMPVCEEDPRPGGAFRWEWRGPGGMAMTIRGEYQEVDPPRRLARTETFELGCEGQAGEQVAVTEFTEDAGVTTLVLSLTYPSAQARDATLASGMEHGMAASYARLARLLTGAEGEART